MAEEATHALTEKQIQTILNSGDEEGSLPLQEALAAAEVELKAALETDGYSHGQLDLSDSAMLRRFLIARKLQIPATVAMLEAHAKWAEQTYPIELPEVLGEIRKGKAYSHGVDAQGNPLVFVCSRNFDPRTRDLATAVRATVYMVDEAVRLSSKTGGQISIFYDRSDFSASKNLDLALIKAVVTTLSENYPERLAALYLYPAGSMASMVFRLVSPLLDPRQRSKVHLLTSEALLRQSVPDAYVPVRYGGTSTFVFDPKVYEHAAGA